MEPVNPDAQGFPLSPQQRQLWAHAGSGEAGSPFTVECRVAAPAGLDPDRLAEAARRLVARHEILRARYRRIPTMTTPLLVVPDGSGGEEQAVALDPAPGDRPGTANFDLESGPILKLSTVFGEDGSCELRLEAPALVTDLAGLRLLLADLAEEYVGSGASGEEDEALTYIDLAQWQNDLLEDDETAPERGFWWEPVRAARAAGGNLPFEQPAPEGPARFSRRRSPVPPEVARRLATLARELETTPAEVVLSLWAALLARLTGWREVVVGVAFDGRSYEILEAAPGLFERCLPIRVELGGHPAIPDLVRAVDRALHDAHEHQEYFTWEAAGEAAGAAPYHPYCFETLDLEDPVPWGDSALSIRSAHGHTDRFHLKLSLVQRLGALDLELHNDEAAVVSEEAELLLRRVLHLIEGATATDARGVHELDLVLPDERRAVLAAVREARGGEKAHCLVPDLVGEWIARAPDRVAVLCGDHALTYGRLGELSDRLAARLRSLGVGPERRVALLLERSPALVAAMLAVLRSGGAYVPLDPSLPAPRLEEMATASGAAVLVTERSERAVGLEGPPATLVVEEVWEDGAGSGGPMEVAVPPPAASLAYVLFTSGSTGAPKAVGIEHRQLAHYAGSVARALELDEQEGFATVSTAAADLGNTAIYGALTTGGCLHLVPADAAVDPDALAAQAVRGAFDGLKIVPSHLAALLAESPDPELLPRRRLVLGGEPLPWDLVSGIRRLAGPELAIFNHYGPTESTVGVLLHRVSDEPSGTVTVPLGEPLGVVWAHPVDPRGSLVPPWIPGELRVGGASVGRGYLGAPAATAARFVPDPLAGTPGARAYRTGDLVRRSGDGSLEFVGRIDLQLKLRGFRVEPGEIEARLRGEPGVRQAAVVAVGEGALDRHLAAFVVGEDAASPPEGEALREALRTSLPDFMMPARIVALERLPLTANGKVDRGALSAKAGETPADLLPFEAPRTDVERRIAELWQELLGIPEVGRRLDFFAAGGHSLRAAQVIARLNRAFGVELSFASIFEAPTPAELAQRVEEALVEQIESLTDEEAEELAGSVEAESAVGPVPKTEWLNCGDGVEILCPNRVEAEHLRREIFDRRIYLRHGIELRPGGCVFDVGANIGLFALFAEAVADDVEVFAFEPAPPLFELLSRNLARVGSRARAFPVGLSNRSGELPFCYYPHTPAMSSFYADAAQEKEIFELILEEERRNGAEGIDELLEMREDFLDHRFAGEWCLCEVKTLSEVLRETGREGIDLLKIDVQKSELDVLRGIEAGDWPKIRQVVCEIHDHDGLLRTVRELFASHGFTVAVDQDGAFVGSSMFTVYATRPRSAATRGEADRRHQEGAP